MRHLPIRALARGLGGALMGAALLSTTPAQADSGSDPIAKFETGAAGAEAALANKGIDVTGYYVGGYYANVSGGLKRTNVYFNDLAFGANLDLAKIASIPGASIHFTIDARFGGFPQGVNDLTGSSVGFLGGTGPDNRARLNEFTYRQQLAGGMLSFLVGRTTLANFFATSDLFCYFSTSICSNLTPLNWSANSNEPFYPIAVWAGEVEVKPTPVTYFRVGASESNPDQYNGGGFPWDQGWTTDHATGAFIPVEFGYSTEGGDSAAPGRYDIGFFRDTSRFGDARYNTAGGRLLLDGGMPANDGGRSSIYIQAEQVLWHAGTGPAARKLWGFAGAMFDVSGHSTVQNFYQAGLLMLGTLPGRPKDSAGLLATFYTFNARVTGATNDAIIAAGGSGHMSRTETIMEANYGVDIGYNITVKPFIDLTLDPDQALFDVAVPRPNVRYALAVGSNISFGF